MWREDHLMADHSPAEEPENNWQENPDLLSGPLQGAWLASPKLAVTLAIYGFHFRQVIELHVE